MTADSPDVSDADAAAVKMACYGLAKEAGGFTRPTTGQVAVEADVSAAVAESVLDDLYYDGDPALDVDVEHESQHRVVWRVSL